MIPIDIRFELPVPWVSKEFQVSKIGELNLLVGPNGSGKSRFATALKSHLTSLLKRSQVGKVRLLGTDRLRGMERHNLNFIGDPFVNGLAKNLFSNIKSAGDSFGSGLDTVIILDERLDIRVRVEATLSHLFNRRIILEWDSGHLVPKAMLGRGGTSYRLDTEECHGIKELLVLLTHLYNDESSCLIIDEPELNLHPQYQSFFMQEVRRVAGNPLEDPTKKLIFLVTHSPFILDFSSVDDVKSVFSFQLDHSVPRQIADLDEERTRRLTTLVPRLNVHHKQLFFSDNPVFVEGIFDAQIVQLLQERRGVSIAAAGSCIIDAGGKGEVTKYLELCLGFGKEAYFLYDLDALFSGSLKECIREDATLAGFLALQGVGADFVRYCGELERLLTNSIRTTHALQSAGGLQRLVDYLRGLGPIADFAPQAWAKARVAVLVQIGRDREAMEAVLGAREVSDILGRLNMIDQALGAKNIVILTAGALEHYLPGYSGDLFEISDDAKRDAVAAEVEFLSAPRKEQELRTRYGGLYEAICRLPSKSQVSIDDALKEYLGNYIHEIQGLIVTQREWQLSDFQSHFSSKKGLDKLFSLVRLDRGVGTIFTAEVAVTGAIGTSPRRLTITQDTNAGMRAFDLPPTCSGS